MVEKRGQQKLSLYIFIKGDLKMNNAMHGIAYKGKKKKKGGCGGR
jgi:hypothetical protein